MKKYSKNSSKKRTLLKFLIGLLVVFLVLNVALLVYILLNNNITYEKYNEDAKFVSEDVAKNSTPIIMDNVLVGGVYDKKWVSSDRYYLNSTNKSNLEIDVYSKTGKKGKYELTSISQASSKTVYSAITNTNLIDEYFAIAKSDTSAMNVAAKKRQTVTENEIKMVKKALGIYRLFNTSVKITEVYDISLSQGENFTLIFATNEVGKSTGVYSAVVCVDNMNKAKLVKYSYVRDKDNAADWPIYSLKFVADLNLDGTNEIVLQETKEFEVKYSVLEYEKNEFKEVIGAVIK